MLLSIELSSDLCTYSGDVYNSLVDIDVVYDSYGFPYIPAKRIKGCIREACLELVDFGVVPEDSYNRIFGEKGSRASGFTISNACLKDYEALCKDLEEYRQMCVNLDAKEDELLIHPQNVLGLYTYMRVQTSMNYETGAAEKTTLRTMRVVKKGTVFQARISAGSILSGEDIRNLENAIQLVKHMGVHRTRGLGLVKITIDKEAADHDIKSWKEESVTICQGEIQDKNILDYRIYLKAPMICKSSEGNQAKSQNFIEGSKVLGLIAGAMGNRAFQEMMEGQSAAKKNELVVSNAYIECGKRRCHPISASLQKVKDQTFDDEDRMEVYDMLAAKGVTEQLTPVGLAYMTEDGVVKSVSTEIHYHHSRPEDKSIGRADGGQDSSFYQLESIGQGQSFRGYILADRTQAEKIIEAFRKMKNIRMGYGKNAEYGGVRMSIESIRKPDERKKDRSIQSDFVVRLDSPVILYNENGMPTSDVEIFRKYMAEILKSDDLVLENCFLKYETIGGFNVTWGRRKPVFTALGRGTVCRFHSEKGVDVSVLKYHFAGERVSEGYGEIKVLKIPKERYVLRKPAKEDGVDERRERTFILSELRRERAIKDLAEEARLAALKKRDLYARGDNNAVISRLILVNKEQPGYEKMREQIEGWESESKKDVANKVLDDIERILSKIPEGEVDKDKAYTVVTAAYLQQMKHQYRSDKRSRGGSGDGEE